MTTVDRDRLDEATVELVAKVLDRWAESGPSYQPAGFYPSDRDNAAEAVVQALAEAGLLLPPGGEISRQWAVRVDRPHPARREKAGDYIKLADEALAHHGPKIWDGWVTVARTIHVGPWLPVDGPASDADRRGTA